MNTCVSQARRSSLNYAACNVRRFLAKAWPDSFTGSHPVGDRTVLKKRDRFNDSSASTSWTRFTLSFTSTREVRMRRVREYMNERPARSEPEEIRTALPNRL